MVITFLNIKSTVMDAYMKNVLSNITSFHMLLEGAIRIVEFSKFTGWNKRIWDSENCYKTLLLETLK